MDAKTRQRVAARGSLLEDRPSGPKTKPSIPRRQRQGPMGLGKGKSVLFMCAILTSLAAGTAAVPLHDRASGTSSVALATPTPPSAGHSQRIVLLAATPPRDDYPQLERSAAPDTIVPDDWGYANRECTSFVAWRMARDGHPIPNGWYNANLWGNEAGQAGFVVNSTPTVGAIAQWNAGTNGHVAYVSQVNPDGSVNTEDYNWASTGVYAFHLNVRAERYIHIGAAPA